MNTLQQEPQLSSNIKTFYMTREADESGVSGVGKVLDGVVFPDGQTVIRWCVSDKPNSTAIYPTFADFKLIHVDSHPTNGTRFFWNDELATARAEGAADEWEKHYPYCKCVNCIERRDKLFEALTTKESNE